jgi:hypothetical protein
MRFSGGKAISSISRLVKKMMRMREKSAAVEPDEEEFEPETFGLGTRNE